MQHLTVYTIFKISLTESNIKTNFEFRGYYDLYKVGQKPYKPWLTSSICMTCTKWYEKDLWFKKGH
jgi:hypothetical protein